MNGSSPAPLPAPICSRECRERGSLRPRPIQRSRPPAFSTFLVSVRSSLRYLVVCDCEYIFELGLGANLHDQRLQFSDRRSFSVGKCVCPLDSEICNAFAGFLREVKRGFK